MTATQRRIIEHALGLPRAKAPYRNHFCTGRGSTNWADCRALCKAGMMRDAGKKGGVFGGDHLFHVTSAGAAAVGAALPTE